MYNFVAQDETRLTDFRESRTRVWILRFVQEFNADAKGCVVTYRQ